MKAHVPPVSMRVVETRENCNKDCTHTLSVCGNLVCEYDSGSDYHSNW